MVFDMYPRWFRAGVTVFLMTIGVSCREKATNVAATPSPVTQAVAIAAQSAARNESPATKAAAQPDATTSQGVSTPPDGQLLRDAAGAVSDSTLRDLGASGFRKLRVVSKEIDQYERDECNTVVEGRIVPYGPKILVFGRYSKAGTFWKLVGQEAKGY